MVWPILISVSVTPGALAAHEGFASNPRHITAESAVTRITLRYVSPCIRLELRRVPAKLLLRRSNGWFTSTPAGRCASTPSLTGLVGHGEAVCNSSPRQAVAHAKVLTSAWACGVTDFNRLSYAKDAYESGGLCPRTGKEIIGYARVSTDGQSLDSQERNAQGSGSGPDLSRDGKRGEGGPAGAGRARAKTRRVHMGRPPKLTAHQKREALNAASLDGSASQADLARRSQC